MLVRVLLAIALSVAAHMAVAQSYPDKNRPIRIIVPFGAGSGGDLVSRAYARAMNEGDGLNVVVENKPGAEGVIGLEHGKNAAPDGYTLVWSNLSTHVLNVHQQANLPYNPVVDFTPLINTESVALVLNAGPSTKLASIREAIASGRSAPGKLSYGSSTASTRLAMEMFEHQAQVKYLAVPYKTQAQATAALAGGEVDLLMTDVVTALPFYKSARLRPLAVTSAERLAALPEVPTLRELDLKDYEFAAWSGLFVPVRTPPEVTDKLRAILQRASQSKYVLDAVAVKASEMPLLPTGEFNALIKADIERWGRVLRDMKAATR
jgi:tripartite-type tricarboxylate transporter receptor subunit TctC